MKKIILKIRLFLIWILIPKNRLRTTIDIAENTYDRVIKIYPNNKTAMYFVVAAIMAYRFPNLNDLHKEAIEYSKLKDSMTPKIGDYHSFNHAARFIYFWMDKRENEKTNPSTNQLIKL